MKPARTLLILAAALSAGCSTKNADLERFIAQTKQEQPGGVEALPEVKPYESFFYADQGRRSPFMPGGSGGASSGVRPDVKRNREVLELSSLDTLQMVGTLTTGGRNYGLVKSRDGLVHRVQPGNYVGQNDGRITAIDASRIIITEIVPDGLGGYMERPAALTLNE
jgi:type IV pilus assembly protein PilP